MVVLGGWVFLMSEVPWKLVRTGLLRPTLTPMWHFFKAGAGMLHRELDSLKFAELGLLTPTRRLSSYTNILGDT